MKENILDLHSSGSLDDMEQLLITESIYSQVPNTKQLNISPERIEVILFSDQLRADRKGYSAVAYALASRNIYSTSQEVIGFDLLLTVHPAQRGRGLSRKLLNEFINGVESLKYILGAGICIYSDIIASDQERSRLINSLTKVGFVKKHGGEIPLYEYKTKYGES